MFCNTILLRNKIKSKLVDGAMRENFILLSLNDFGVIFISGYHSELLPRHDIRT